MINHLQHSRPILTASFLLVLTVLSGAIRFAGFNHYKTTHRVTVDENVYYSIAKQLLKDPLDYSARGFVERIDQEGHKHAYMSAPLFKHPPLYCYLLALSLKAFHDAPFAVILISLISGCLLIPLVYFLARAVTDQVTAVLAALVMAADTVSMICAQKVWLDSTLEFLVVLAAFFFIKGMERRGFFIWAGVAAGLAALTKYPGILILVPVLLFASTRERTLFKIPHFRAGLAIPFLMLFPWVIWNIRVYGLGFYWTHLTEHGLPLMSEKFFVLLAGGMILAAAIIFLRTRRAEIKRVFVQNARLLRAARIAVPLVAAALLAKPLFNSLLFSRLPQITWAHGELDRSAGVFFYIKKLLEFSFLYALAYGSLLAGAENSRPGLSFIKMNAVVYLIFFSIYGNYQSRYIVMALPFLIILAAQLWTAVYDRIARVGQKDLRTIYYILWGGLLCLSLAKTWFINIQVSLPNDMCYF